MGGCGFAHCLSDLSIPAESLEWYSCLWRDRSRERGGPAGIDWFVGQAYSPPQWERLLLYLDSEPVASMPPWARRLSWYMDHGEPDEYVMDGDFQWAAEARLYLDIAVTYEPDRVLPCFPFDLAEDRRGEGMSLDERMYRRMTTGVRAYELYRAVISWQDNTKFADSANPGLSKYDRQYLALEGGVEYVRILDSSGDAPWWYMVQRTALPKILSCGGWAPPSYFEPPFGRIILFEVPLHVLTDVSEVSAEEVGAAPHPSDVSCIRVSVDGSPDDRRGIAAGCVASGVSMTTRASLTLPGITGAEASELLGITLGLCVCYLSRRMHSRFVILVDSANARNHVFFKQDPANADGWHLWPLILLARNLVDLLREMGIDVSSEKVSSRRNTADHIAKSEMRYRRECGWMYGEDRWPDPLPPAFQEVWRCVAKYRMDMATVVLCKSFVFSDEVFQALDSFVRGTA